MLQILDEASLNSIKKFIAKCFDKTVVHTIFNDFSLFTISSFRGWTKVMMQSKSWLEKVKSSIKAVNVVGSGILVGWIWGGEFIPSPHLYNFLSKISSKMGCGVIAKPHGVKLFCMAMTYFYHH